MCYLYRSTRQQYTVMCWPSSSYYIYIICHDDGRDASQCDLSNMNAFGHTCWFEVILFHALTKAPTHCTAVAVPCIVRCIEQTNGERCHLFLALPVAIWPLLATHPLRDEQRGNKGNTTTGTTVDLYFRARCFVFQNTQSIIKHSLCLPPI